MKNYDEFNEMNEGVEKRKNTLLTQLDEYINRKTEINLELDKQAYDDIYRSAEENNWNGVFVLEKDPTNSLQKILKFQPQ